MNSTTESELIKRSSIQNISYYGHCIGFEKSRWFSPTNSHSFYNSYSFNIGKKNIKVFSSKTLIRSFIITGIQNQSQLNDIISQLDFNLLSIDISLINIKTKLSVSNINLLELGNHFKKNINNIRIIYDNLLHSSLRLKTEYFTIMIFTTGTTVISLKHYSWNSDCFKILMYIEKFLKSKQQG